MTQSPLKRFSFGLRFRRLFGGQLSLYALIAATDTFDDSMLFVVIPILSLQYHFSDTAISFLPFAESLAYGLAAIPIAVLADRFPRKPVILWGLLGWALFSALSGATIGLWSFVVVRFFMGVFQPFYDAPALSALSDGIPAQRRGRAFGIINFAEFGGIVAGLVVESALTAIINWRWVFLLVCGQALVVFVLAAKFLREPARGAADGRPLEARPVSFWTAFREALPAIYAEGGKIWKSKPQLCGVGGRVLHSFAFYGIGFFFPLLLVRFYHFDNVSAQSTFAVVVIMGLVGSLLGGWVDSWLVGSFGSGIHLIIAGVSLAAAGALFATGVIIGILPAVLVASALTGIFLGSPVPSLGALVGDLYGAERRTYAFAVQIAPAYCVAGIAPVLVGGFSTWFDNLAMALVVFCCFIVVLGGLLASGARLLRKSPVLAAT